MKNIVLKYGTISGVLAILLVCLSTFMENKYGFGKFDMPLGIIRLILAFIPLYIGVKAFRDTIGNGYLTFMKGLHVGILIVVISGIFYTISWLVIYYWVTPDYPDKISAYVIDQMKLAKDSAKVIEAATKQLTDEKEMLKNPFINGAATFAEPLIPSGLIMTLICAGILRKKDPSAAPMKDLLQN